MYDILKQKEKNCHFFVDGDLPAFMLKRKTLRTANNADLDNVYIELIHQKQTEHMPLSDPLFTENNPKHFIKRWG